MSPTAGTSSGANAGGSSNNAGSDRDSFSRWRDRQYYGPRRWFHGSRDESQWEKDTGNLPTFTIEFH